MIITNAVEGEALYMLKAKSETKRPRNKKKILDLKEGNSGSEIFYQLNYGCG